MKKILYIILYLLFYNISAQTFDESIIVDIELGAVNSVLGVDLDSDGDNDIVSSSFNNINWYENVDGNGMFSPANGISSGIGQSFSVFPADLDGDGDIDILTTFFDLDLVSWYENLDGNGSFSKQNIISDIMDGPIPSLAVDLDQDNDLDVLIASDGDDILAWFENENGNGEFSQRQIITSTSTNSRAIGAADLDGDNDIDVVTSSIGSNSAVWFENIDGLGTFGTENVIPGSPGVETLVVNDIDGDNDFDIIVGIPAINSIIWFENEDGNGTFGTGQIISSTATFVRQIQAVDIDDDDDLDVISCSQVDNALYWHENVDGLGTFGQQQLIGMLENGRTLFAIDIDGDGDNDVISGTRRISAINHLVWFPNLTYLGVTNIHKKEFILYPNPAQDKLHILLSDVTLDTTYRIINVLGQELISGFLQNSVVDVTGLSDGVYIIQISDGMKIASHKFIKE